MQTSGLRMEATTMFTLPVEDVEDNTIRRKMFTAEKPKRQSLIAHTKPRNPASIIPVTMNRSHKPQQKRERAIILLLL